MYSASHREIGQHDDGVYLEVWAKLLSSSVTCWRLVYRVSASDRDLVTKNIGLCFWFLSSLNKAAHAEASDTAR